MNSSNSKIRSFLLAGPAGNLEAILNEGSAAAAFSALACHPHPLFGGTMHNKVVYHAMKALNSFGIPVLRFNFRGAGRSEGEHDRGRGEVGDVKAAIDWLDGEFHRPIVFCGFSFGAATGLRAACPDPRISALISLGTPINAEGRNYGYDFLVSCGKPKLFVSGDSDQYGARDKLEQLAEAAPPPKKLVIVPDADHFFAGHLAEMRNAITDWIANTLKLSSSAGNSENEPA